MGLSMSSERTEVIRNDLGEALLPIDEAGISAGLVGGVIYPTRNTTDIVGQYFELDAREWLSIPETSRATGGNYNRSNMRWKPKTFAVDQYGLEDAWDMREAATYPDAMRYEETIARRLHFRTGLAREKRIADKVLVEAPYAADSRLQTNPVNEEWNTVAGNPIVEVQKALKMLAEKTGFWANTLVVNRFVANALKLHPAVIARLESGGAGKSTLLGDIYDADLAKAFDIEKFCVAGGLYHKANEAAALSIDSIWKSNYAWLGLTANAGDQDLKVPCYGRTMNWTGFGSDVHGVIETYYEPQNHSKVYRERFDIAEVDICPQLSVLIKNIWKP